MNENEENITNSTDVEIKFEVEYQRRTRRDLIKLFIIDNLKAIRGYLRFTVYSLPAMVLGLIYDFLFLKIITIGLLSIIVIGAIGFYMIWRQLKNYEKSQIPERAFTKERSLRYGDFGIVHKVFNKNGLAEEKYTWSRYKYLIKWDNQLFLLPAKNKASYFVLRSDEIGRAEFAEFEEYTRSKLPFKKIKRYREILI